MKNTNWKKNLSLCAIGLLALQACNTKPDHKQEVKTKQDSTVKETSGAQYAPVNTWIDDFRNFRTAVYQKDIDKQKSYFDFPVNADTTQIWELVYDGAEEGKRPETFPGTFTEGDFLKHRSAIFTEAFTKSLLKVKSEKITQADGYTTPKINDGKDGYYMVASYDKAAKTLTLTLSYPGGTDEEGNYVSEGEYAIIYFFKVENNKYLKFEKVLFAG